MQFHATFDPLIRWTEVQTALVRSLIYDATAEALMQSLHDHNGKTRLWFDGRYEKLLDLWGNPLATIKDGIIRNLRSEQVAFWKNSNVIDLDGSVLLRRGHRKDGPERRVLPVLAKRDDPSGYAPRPMRKAWGSEIAFIETLRLASLEYL
jgi:hypothetical protein